MKKFNVKAIVNKKNGQINVSLPKRKLGKKNLKKILEKKELKLMLEF
jgi:hypothetical protein